MVDLNGNYFDVELFSGRGGIPVMAVNANSAMQATVEAVLFTGRILSKHPSEVVESCDEQIKVTYYFEGLISPYYLDKGDVRANILKQLRANERNRDDDDEFVQDRLDALMDSASLWFRSQQETPSDPRWSGYVSPSSKAKVEDVESPRPYIREGSTQDLITKKCDQVKNLLLRKNADYGNSALDPVRIFSKADAEEQIRVRIDDKLSRLAGAGEKNFTEDTVMDLVGYLILLMVKMEGGE